MSTMEIQSSYKDNSIFNPPWKPVPDDDFFPGNLEENPNYKLSKRFVICYINTLIKQK